MEPLRFGILSTARVAARRLLPALRATRGSEVRAVASRDAARAQAFAAAHQIPRAYASYEALLADPAIDAVYIPLPNALHHEWTIRAAQARKHVLCEKPFAASAQQVDEMIAACEANGVRLMEAFMYRFHPQTLKVQALIAEGAIGAVQLVRAVFGFTITPESNVRLSAPLAGGSLLDVGSYCVNVARTLLGAEPHTAMASAQIGARSRVDEMAAGVLQFSNEALCAFECGFRMPFRSHYEVIGARGRIEVPTPFITNNKETQVILHQPDDRAQTFGFPPVDQYALMVEHFVECVQRGLPFRYPPAEGRAQMRALDALAESIRTGKVVRL